MNGKGGPRPWRLWYSTGLTYRVYITAGYKSRTNAIRTAQVLLDRGELRDLGGKLCTTMGRQLAVGPTVLAEPLAQLLVVDGRVVAA